MSASDGESIDEELISMQIISEREQQEEEEKEPTILSLSLSSSIFVLSS